MPLPPRPVASATYVGGAVATQSPLQETQGDPTFPPLKWWLSVTSPRKPDVSGSFEARERLRRGRLVSVLLLTFLLIEVGAFWQYLVVDDDHPAMVVVLVAALLIAVAAGALNRLGRVTVAAALLVIVADLPLAGVHATAVGGNVDIPHIGAYYLLAGSVLIAASALPAWTIFLVAAANSALTFFSLALAPKTPALAHLLTSVDGQQIFAGPIAMQAVVAVVAFLWSRSTLTALRRADRAEEVAELERREVERNRELEEGVRQLLDVHVQLANGNFAAHVPPVRNQLLWQVGSSLNTLIARFARLAQGERLALRMQEEAQRLTEAVHLAQSGRQPIWPAPSGTPLDQIIVALSGRASAADASMQRRSSAMPTNPAMTDMRPPIPPQQIGAPGMRLPEWSPYPSSADGGESRQDRRPEWWPPE